MSNDCPHFKTVLVQIDCGSGGIQFRKYCTACWRAVGGAIPHANVREIIAQTGIEPPLADLEIIHRAQKQVHRSSYGWR